MPTTELVVLTLKSDAAIGDPKNYASTVLQQTCKTLFENNAISVYFGIVVEDNALLRLVINWPSYSVHQTFMASDKYQGFLSNIRQMLAGPPKIVHVDFKAEGALDAILSGPVTEFVSFYHDGDVPADYGEGVAKIEALKDKLPGNGIAWGSTYETVEHDGVKGKAAVVAIGWDSVEQHMEFRQTPTMAEIGPHLVQSSKGMAMQHIQAMKFVE